jgi:hypothetical protein
MKSMDLQATIRKRQQRWERFVKPGAAPGFMFMVRCNDPEMPPKVAPWPSLQKERVEWIWKTYQRQRDGAAWLEDDFIPHLNMLTGTEIFAEAFGCQVHRPQTNMPFALPLIRTAPEVAGLQVPELSTSTLAYLFDMADELHRRDPDAVFRLIDVQSPMDIAALIWEKELFFLALVEEPEAVKELVAKVRQLMMAFLDEWFRRYGTRYVAHFPDYFMTSGVTLSEDEVGTVSPDMVEEFFLPELAALSNRYGGLGMHCCANSRHQWANFKKIPGLRVLNIIQPLELTQEAFRFFADGPVQMHWAPVASGPIETWPGQYPAQARVIIEVPVNTKAEAVAAANTLNGLNSRKLHSPLTGDVA